MKEVSKNDTEATARAIDAEQMEIELVKKNEKFIRGIIGTKETKEEKEGETLKIKGISMTRKQLLDIFEDFAVFYTEVCNTVLLTKDNATGCLHGNAIIVDYEEKGNPLHFIGMELQDCNLVTSNSPIYYKPR
jgi:hypothetical protein